MTPWITRLHCVSAAGVGVDALVDAACAGRSLARPVPWGVDTLRSPFAALAGCGGAEEMLLAVVEAVAPPEGAGLVVATSSGDISGPFEAWHAAHRDLARTPGARAGWRQAPTHAVAARLGLAPATTLSVACASGTAAFAVARGWLRDGVCTRVIVAGVDALSLYVHAGFAGLGALAKAAPRPFGAGRDGLLLGEAAAAFLLETPASAAAAGRAPMVALLGCGLSQDGVHLTAPDRTGGGLARATRAALAEAGVAAGDIGAVSAHATSTVFNDAMEARALASVFDGPVPLHALKPVVGHTLGAAGAIEAALLVALLRGAPPPAPPDVTDPDCPIVPAPTKNPRVGLSVSAAFGGVNAAVVFGPAETHADPSSGLRPPSPRLAGRRAQGADFTPHGETTRAEGPPTTPLSPPRGERVPGGRVRGFTTTMPAENGGGVAGGATPPPQKPDAHIATHDLPLSRVFSGAPPALGRADAYVRAGIAVLAEIRDALGPDVAVVLASASNCHAADVRYHAGLLDGGPPHASRLHFSYTIPGAPIAEAAILLGLKGPVLAFCDGPARAHEEAARLARAGTPAVAVTVEAPGAPTPDRGAWAEAEATVYPR